MIRRLSYFHRDWVEAQDSRVSGWDFRQRFREELCEC